MILDYSDNQLILTEEKNESFISVQDVSKMSLCARIINKKYYIPFVALPIVISALNKLDYKIVYTPALKVHYSAFNAERKQLEMCKNGNSTLNEVRRIKRFIEEQTKNIKKRIPDFSYFQSQIDTIIYGIIGKTIIIGNDVGTGKTLASMTICKYLFRYTNLKKAIIMLPASLATNFLSDYEKFFADNDIMLIGSLVAKKRKQKWQEFRNSTTTKFLTTNYEKCRTDFDELRKCNFDIIIVDEFHKMKNFTSAKMSINFFNLIDIWEPEYKIPMSGSPIENKLFDLYPIFKLLDDGNILGGKNFFDKNFIIYEEIKYWVKSRYGGHYIKTEQKAVGFKNHSYLKKLIKPFIIRKKLKLPVKLYRSNVLLETPPIMRRIIGRIAFNSDNAMQAYSEIRQFLCDTRRHNLNYNPKLEYLENLLEQTRDKVIIFSFYKCSISAIAEFLKAKRISYITCQGGDGTDALDVVKQFNNSDIKVLITTDKINYGHNIQSAKWVIEWDKPIKPSTSVQRAGRAYRSGQTEDVHMVSLVYKNTVEEIILQKTKLKEELITAIIEGIVNEEDYPDVFENETDIETEVIKSFTKFHKHKW